MARHHQHRWPRAKRRKRAVGPGAAPAYQRLVLRLHQLLRWRQRRPARGPLGRGRLDRRIGGQHRRCGQPERHRLLRPFRPDAPQSDHGVLRCRPPGAAAGRAAAHTLRDQLLLLHRRAGGWRRDRPLGAGDLQPWLWRADGGLHYQRRQRRAGGPRRVLRLARGHPGQRRANPAPPRGRGPQQLPPPRLLRRRGRRAGLRHQQPDVHLHGLQPAPALRRRAREALAQLAAAPRAFVRWPRLPPTALGDLDVLRAARDLFATDPDGQAYISLYYTHAVETGALAVADPDLADEAYDLLQDFLPGLSALVSGQGHAFIIHPELVDRTNHLADALSAAGSPALAAAIAAERAKYNDFRTSRASPSPRRRPHGPSRSCASLSAARPPVATAQRSLTARMHLIRCMRAFSPCRVASAARRPIWLLTPNSGRSSTACPTPPTARVQYPHATSTHLPGRRP